MQIQLESTTKIVQLDIAPGVSVPARLWEGHTASGIPVHCYVTRIAVDKNEDTSQFEAELRECRAPSASVAAIPSRLVL